MFRLTVVACVVAVAFGASSDASGSGSSGSEGGSDKKGAIKVSVHVFPIPTYSPRNSPELPAANDVYYNNLATLLCEAQTCIHARHLTR